MTTDTTPEQVPVPGPTTKPAPKTKIAWHRRLPSPRRFLLWNLLCWSFGASALVGGIAYTEHVVRPVAELGGTTLVPTEMFKQEASSQRAFGNTDRMNILVLGIDYNHDSKGIIYTTGARSDTMMVISLSREGKFLNVVSIPRDTQVLIGEGYGRDKINAAYSYGGVEQAKKTVSDFLGIPIHHHLVVKVDGAKKVVDALGGLPIDVEKDLNYDDNWGNLHIHLKQGPQVLDGEQAVGYARFRMDEEGDRGRIRRQQQVIRALGSKLKEPALVTRFQGLAKEVKDALDTDLKVLEMVDLANLYGSFDFKNMRSAAIVGDDAVDANGISYILPYDPENERTVRRLLKSFDWISKADLRIRVYFKGAAPDIAYRLADRLLDSGFSSVQVEALPLDDSRDSKETHLVWYNKVNRLEGVLESVLGSIPEQQGKQATGRDDDLAIIVGDTEQGRWEELPEHLKQARVPAPPRQESRYSGDFVPRQLPPSQHSIEDPYVPGEAEFMPEAEDVDVTEETYPTANGPEPLPVEVERPRPKTVEIVPPAPDAPREETVQIVPPPEPAPVPMQPQPVATPIGL